MRQRIMQTLIGVLAFRQMACLSSAIVLTRIQSRRNRPAGTVIGAAMMARLLEK